MYGEEQLDLNPLRPSALSVAQSRYKNEKDGGPRLRTKNARRLCKLSPLVSHFDDFRKSEEAAEIIGLAFTQRGGRR